MELRTETSIFDDKLLKEDINNVQETADNAQVIAGTTAQYFWFLEEISGVPEGVGTGAHITNLTKEEFLYDPANGGGNLLARSNGIAVRDGLTELATFGADGATIGKSDGAHSVIDANGQRFYSVWGTLLANIGYGEGTAGETGSVTADAPYFTFGGRYTPLTHDYDETQVYRTGDCCIYNDKIYICINTVTSGTWQQDSWELLIGANSFTEGEAKYASGVASHAEGQGTMALGAYSHAEGVRTLAWGYESHAEGLGTEASKSCSHAEGWYTTAGGVDSHAQNRNTIANYRSQTAMGKFNNNKSSNALEIGNGTSDSNRSNALEVTWDGDVTASGKVNGHSARKSLWTGAWSSGSLYVEGISKYHTVEVSFTGAATHPICFVTGSGASGYVRGANSYCTTAEILDYIVGFNLNHNTNTLTWVNCVLRKTNLSTKAVSFSSLEVSSIIGIE